MATKHGVEAKNYEGLGDAAKLKPLEVNSPTFCLFTIFFTSYGKDSYFPRRISESKFDCQVELKRLEDLSESIVQDFAHMRQREVSVCIALHSKKKKTCK